MKPQKLNEWIEITEVNYTVSIQYISRFAVNTLLVYDILCINNRQLRKNQ